MIHPISLRAPGAFNGPTVGFVPPTTEWLSGTWHVTHSTLPMWKSKRNVTITYKALDPAAGGTEQGTDRLDDIVSYQSLTSDKFKTVVGVDKASGQDTGAWDWRGKGWLAIASSHWEVLGYGDGDRSGEQWAVTYFAKTLFTPAGIDIYSRSQNGLSEAILANIKKALAAVDDSGVKKLATEVFEIKRDNVTSN
ncbi:hypothetical protein MMC24_000840 [Lignoscripta atroalba]|nr:hypothetical protein [Lignoscripta atroalba]